MDEAEQKLRSGMRQDVELVMRKTYIFVIKRLAKMTGLKDHYLIKGLIVGFKIIRGA